jgi:hypothetical protein
MQEPILQQPRDVLTGTRSAELAAGFYFLLALC